MPGKVTRPPFVPFQVPIHGYRTPKYFVFHTTEGTGTIEGLAAYFRNSGEGLGVNYITEPGGRMGSIGNFKAETWHVASHNSECIGLEQIGYHTRTSRQWFLNLRQLWAAAWIAAWVSQELDIPLQRCAQNRRWTMPSGFCQHSDVPDNDHQDCGAGFPFGWVLATAGKWKANGVPIWVRAALPKK